MISNDFSGGDRFCYYYYNYILGGNPCEGDNGVFTVFIRIVFVASLVSVELYLLCLFYILNGAGFKYSYASRLKPAMVFDLPDRTYNATSLGWTLLGSSEVVLAEEIAFARVSSGEIFAFAVGMFYYC